MASTPGMPIAAGEPDAAGLLDQQEAVLGDDLPAPNNDAVGGGGAHVRHAVGVAPDPGRERRAAHLTR